MNKKIALIAAIGFIIIVGAGYSYTTLGTGKLVIMITDPPEHWGSASKVYIRYSEIKIHRANAGNESGWYTAVEGDSWIDLSTVLDSSEVIGSTHLQAGKYNLIRFEVLDANVTVAGENYTATVSSGNLTVSIMKGGVDISVGQTSHLVIDITPKVMGSTSTGFKVVPATKVTPK
jgi:hypothetical protein